MIPIKPQFPRLLTTLAAIALATSSCVMPPRASDYLDVGFRSPSQAFTSFQTAMAGGLLDLEYRCLSRAFRNTNGIDGMTYRVAREQLMEENPFMKLLSQAEIEDVEMIGASRAKVTVRYKNLLADKSFIVLMQREDFFEAWEGERSAFFDLGSFDEHVFTDEEDPSLLYAIAQAPPEVDPAKLTELTWGREWRIAGFQAAPPSP